MTYDQIQKANETISTISIERVDKKTGETVSKEYAEVNQRIKAFRMVYPDGFILTELLSNENGVCIFQASVGVYENGDPFVLGTGTAQEKESSSFINKTSYIENCETSAVGRALGMCGFGIDTSVASYEEVKTEINNQAPDKSEKPLAQERKASDKQLEILRKYYHGENLAKLLEANQIEKLEDIPMAKASELIGLLTKRRDN